MLEFLVGGENYYMWMLPGLILTIFANFRLRRKTNAFKKVKNEAKVSGKQTARQILDSEDLKKVPVKQVAGNLTDHYDPKEEVVNLSKPIFNPETITAMGVSAHEVGHAIQDKDGYFFMRLRSFIVPFANIGTNLGYILIIAGIVLNITNLSRVGVLLFAATTLFALVTLPVEFNASTRGKQKLKDLGLTRSEEEDKAIDQVLDAARFTYVAAFAVSAIQLVYWALEVRDQRKEAEQRKAAKAEAKTATASVAAESDSNSGGGLFGGSKSAEIEESAKEKSGGLFSALTPKEAAAEVETDVEDGVENRGFKNLWVPSFEPLKLPTDRETRRRWLPGGS